MKHALVAALAALALGCLPAGAFDAAKYPSPTFNTPQVDKLLIQSPGSTGDVSGMSAKATGSPTARTHSSRAADVVNVLDHGAKCDGTTDDTAAITAANTAAVAQGRPMVAPGGTCIVDGLSLTGPLTFRGDADTQTILKRKNSAALTYVVRVNAQAGVSIRELAIDGNKANQALGGNNLLITGSSRYHVSNVATYNAKTASGFGDGLLVQNSTDGPASNGAACGLVAPAVSGDPWAAVAAQTRSSLRNIRAYANDDNGVHLNGTVSNVSIENIQSHYNRRGLYVDNNVFPVAPASITGLSLDNISTDFNSATGLYLQGFVTGGSVANPIYGPNSQAIQCVTANNLSAKYNTGYGVAIQAGRGIFSNIRANANGGRGTFYAGVLFNSDHSTLANVEANVNETYGVDAGGCYECQLKNINVSENGKYSSANTTTQINLGGARYTTLDTFTGEMANQAGHTGKVVGFPRMDGNGAGTGFMWDTTHITVRNGFCRLYSADQRCVVAVQNPKNVIVENNYAIGNESNEAFVLESTSLVTRGNRRNGTFPYNPTVSSVSSTLVIGDETEGFILNSSTATINSIQTRTISSYLDKVLSVEMTANGSGYTTPVATATGGGCTTQPTLRVMTSPDPANLSLKQVANIDVTAPGAGCTSAPTVTITDSGGTGTGATATALIAPWDQINGKQVNVYVPRSLATPFSFGSAARLFTEGNQTYTASGGDNLTLRGFGGVWTIAARTRAKDGVVTGATATGTVQADAYSLIAPNTAFSTVAAGTGARLSSGAPDGQTVINRGANALLVYPPTSGTLDGGTAAFSLAAGASKEFICSTLTCFAK